MNSTSFNQLLSVAERNKVEAKRQLSMVGYSATLAPPKKIQKPGVTSTAIEHFLAKRKADEAEKALQAKQKREHLLSLRSKITKNNKKAKFMASRTKDNDFSNIKLTEDELEAKKKREVQLLQLQLNDKVLRMKARIELEEKEKLLPRKRRRKSKHDVEQGDTEGACDVPVDVKSTKESDSRALGGEEKPAKKKCAPPPPRLSFQDLMKLAEKKQHEPLNLPEVKPVQEEKPLTKKEKKLLMEREERMRKKGAMQTVAESAISERRVGASKSEKSTKQPVKNSFDTKPTVLRVEQDASLQDSSLRATKSNRSFKDPSNVRTKSQISKIPPTVIPKSGQSVQKPVSGRMSSSDMKSHNKQFRGVSLKDKALKSQSSSVKSKPSSKAVAKNSKTVSVGETPALSADILAEMEQKIRAQILQEIEARFKAHDTNRQMPGSIQMSSSSSTQVPSKSVSKTSLPQASKSHQVNRERGPVSKGAMSANGAKGFLPPKQPKKPVFHPNPYLAPPRRLLLPLNPMKRRIESDDDEEDEDMKDFIDDGPIDGDEDYSTHIREIFGYDRSRYQDDNDDDIMESTYAQQMNEEFQSAKIGRLEDLEEKSYKC